MPKVIDLATHRDQWIIDLLLAAGKRGRPSPAQVLWARCHQHISFRAFADADRQAATDAVHDAVALGFDVADVLDMLCLAPDRPEREPLRLV